MPERKRFLDLFRTCLVAVPRCLQPVAPPPMPPTPGAPPAAPPAPFDLLDVLARTTLHVDPELRKLSLHALTHVVSDLPACRLPALAALERVVADQPPDGSPDVLALAVATCHHVRLRATT